MTGSSTTSDCGRIDSSNWMSSWKTSNKRSKEMAVTSSNRAKVTLPTDEQIRIEREFDAPKHLVYQAFTTPELVERWWHANRGDVTSVEIDLRVGGKWRYVMTACGGPEVGFHGEYREIVPGERIVSTEFYEGVPDGVAEEDATTL